MFQHNGDGTGGEKGVGASTGACPTSTQQVSRGGTQPVSYTMKTLRTAVCVLVIAMIPYATVVTAMATRLTGRAREEKADDGSFGLFKNMMRIHQYEHEPRSERPIPAVASLQKDLVVVFDLLFAEGTLLRNIVTVFTERTQEFHVCGYM